MKINDPQATIPGTTSAQTLEEAKSGGIGRHARQDPGKLERAAREFEAYFVQTMMKEMRKTAPKSDLMGGGETMAIFESMLDENMGKTIAQGRGIGLARQLQAYLGGDKDGQGPAHLPISPPAAPFQAGYPMAMRSRGISSYQDADALGEGSGDLYGAIRGGRIPATSGADGHDHREISSGFGSRIHPIFGERRFHAGIDIPMPEGTPVRAAGEGVVVFAGHQRGYGNVVVVEHADGYTTRYAHNSKLKVEEGDAVTADTVLAESGSSGWTTGPHLHFEVRKAGEAVDPTTVSWVKLP